jgi:ATP-dependent exoDNAse (exonuclease V) beta subunit
VTPRLADQDARDRIQSALHETQVVEAAAGTGKTTALVKRILKVIASGVDVANIAAVTFTEKAAGELKLRLREEIEQERRTAAASGDAATLAAFEKALGHLEEAHVSTIHTLCADLLRERPVEARVDPLFVVLTESQADRLYSEVFRTWLHAQLLAPREGVRRSLRRTARRNFGRDIDEDGPVERLRQAGHTLLQWRDHPAEWSRDLDWDRDRAIDALLQAVEIVAALSDKASWREDPVYKNLAAVRAVGAEIARARLEGPVDYDGWEATLVDLSRNREIGKHKGGKSAYAPGISREQILAAREQLTDALTSFQRAADADLASRLHGDLADLVTGYEEAKQAQGALDFLDLLVRARDLVRDNADVRVEFHARFQRIFVDEFQDTDPLQAELLVLLASDESSLDQVTPDWRTASVRPGALFIVGDPKQSIYRFRRADVGVYRDVCNQLVAGGAVRLQLNASFRATPAMQHVINAAFAPVMQDDPVTLQAPYVELKNVRGDWPDRPSVIALPVPAPYGRGKYIAGYAIEDSLPGAVGAMVAWLVNESKWKVTERAGEEPKDLEARHICLLFRRFTSWQHDMTRPYVEALEARGVPHLLVGGKAFHDREEVEAFRLALTAIEWPDDELSVYGTLRGMLFGVGEEELLQYRLTCGHLHPFRTAKAVPPHLSDVTDALQVLEDLHRRRNDRPVADTITTLLDATRAHVGLVLRPAGEQALANVLHLAELARQYEADGGISFRGFVEELREAVGRAEAPEAPILEEGSDGVRLMTVHKAKGLEFPVVILADMTARLAPGDASRFLDVEAGRCAVRIAGLMPQDLVDHQDHERAREAAEGVRLAYVAATRARDLLVVPAVGDEPFEEGWVSPINRALYPPPLARRDAHPPAGVGALIFGKDTVIDRTDGDPARADTVCPGRHQFGSGENTYEVTWWDPGCLELDVEQRFGLRREELITKDVAPAVVEEKLRVYQQWRQRRDEALISGAEPSVVVRTAGEWAASGFGLPGGFELPPVDVLTIRRNAETPSGRRFGTLVHSILASASLTGDSPDLADLAHVEGRVLGASSEETAAARALVRAALEHELLQQASAAAAAGRCRRETPVTFGCPDGSLIEGVVDLAYEHDGQWVVIDFKTDVEIGNEGLERYRRQVGFYAAAIERATGKPARGTLLRL